jgi:hypothetical protein
MQRLWSIYHYIKQYIIKELQNSTFFQDEELRNSLIAHIYSENRVSVKVSHFIVKFYKWRTALQLSWIFRYWFCHSGKILKYLISAYITIQTL